MKKIGLILFTIFVIYGCTENKRNLYDTKPSIYFDKYSEKDTIGYSFTMTKYDKDTIYVDVKLVGRLMDKEGNFTIRVKENSSALAGVHYKELPSSIIFPKGSSKMSLPIVLHDKDKSLNEKKVLLSLRIESNNVFDLFSPAKSELNLTITNMLVKPSYWLPNMNNAFGEYSKVKHQICIDIMGHDFPLTENEAFNFDAGIIGIKGLKYWQMMGRKVCRYIIDNPTEDESGQLISTWEPL